MNKLLKLTAALILIAVTIAFLPACSNSSDRFAPTKTDKQTVMTVGGREVEYQEFRYYFLNNKRERFGAGAELTQEQIDELLRLTEENAKNRHGLLLLAERYGTGVTESDTAEADTYVERYRTEFFSSDEDYLLALADNYMTDDLFRSLQSENLLPYSVLAKMKETGDIDLSDEAMDAAFRSDSILCLKEIYVSKSAFESSEEARNRAEEAHANLMVGAAFEDMMLKYSSYDRASLPPEHGYYTMKYDALDVIWDTAAELAEGEYSYVIESEYGFHIVMKAPKDFEYMESIRDTIVENYSYAKFGEIFYTFAESLAVEYTEFGAALDFSSIE